MKACGYCGTRFNDDAGDHALCSYCEDEMEVVIIEELETKKIDTHNSGITAFYLQDFLTQRDYIMASNGSDSEKLEKLNEYIDKKYAREKWHKEEKHTMVVEGDPDWDLAKEYKSQHFNYCHDNVLIGEVWRDQDNNLCVQYTTTFGRMLDWFHYKFDNGELGWW